MNRNVLFLAGIALAPVAHAGAGAVYIDHATSSIHLSVSNVSGDPDVAKRELAVTSAAPLVHVDGDYGCPVGSTADSLELMMGSASIHYVSPPQLFAIPWDTSPSLDLEGHDYGDFDIDYAVDIPATWDSNAAITLGFNPVQIVEGHYATAEDNNADMVDWMRSDQVFEAMVTMNAVLWCDNGDVLFPGLASVGVDVSIFYHGDPRIQYQAVVDGPKDVTSGETGTPGYDSTVGTSSTAETSSSR